MRIICQQHPRDNQNSIGIDLGCLGGVSSYSTLASGQWKNLLDDRHERFWLINFNCRFGIAQALGFEYIVF